MIAGSFSSLSDLERPIGHCSSSLSGDSWPSSSEEESLCSSNRTRKVERVKGKPGELDLSLRGTTANGEGVVSLLGTGRPTEYVAPGCFSLDTFLDEPDDEWARDRDNGGFDDLLDVEEDPNRSVFERLEVLRGFEIRGSSSTHFSLLLEDLFKVSCGPLSDSDSVSESDNGTENLIWMPRIAFAIVYRTSLYHNR